MGLRETMGRISRGLKAKPPKVRGPITDAMETLQGCLKVAKEQEILEKSPTLRSAEILLDHTEKVRTALFVAVHLVDLLEEPEWTPEQKEKVVKTIAAFKLSCVGARLHQFEKPEVKS